MRLKKVTLLLLILLQISFAYSQDSFKKLDSLTVNEEKMSLIQKNDSLYLKLYENQREVNGRILDTIFWALGGVLAVILAIIGSNIYFNFKFNKKEVDIIKAEAGRDIKEAKNNYLTEINSRFESLSKDLRASVKEEKQSLETNYQERLKTYSDNFKQQIEALNKQIEVQEAMRRRQQDIDKIFIDDAIRPQIILIEMETNENKYEIFFMKESYNVALSAILKVAELELEKGWGWSFEFTGKKIVECLKKVVTISTSDKVSLDYVIEKTGSEHKKLLDEIQALLKNIIVKDWVTVLPNLIK